MPDLYRLTAEQLLELDGYGEISATARSTAIQRVEAAAVLAASCSGSTCRRWAGCSRAILARHFGTVDALMAATQEELEEAEGIGPDRAELIAEWFADDENRALVADSPLARRCSSRSGSRPPVEGPLTGSQYVITGTLEGFSREQAKAALEALGAKVSDSVSKKTTGVIVGESPGSKAAKAEKAGVPILGEADLKALLAGPRSPGATGLAPRLAHGVAEARIVTNRSWAARAAHEETGLPFSSTANTTVAADQARQRAGQVGRARLAPHLPAERRQAVAAASRSRPRPPASRRTPPGSTGRWRRPDHADERIGRQAVEAREPGAVDDADARDRDARLAHRRDRRAGRRRPTSRPCPPPAASCLSSISA